LFGLIYVNMDNLNLKMEGDINLTGARKDWVEKLPFETREVLASDGSCFLHQALSTPCLEVITGCDGPYIITHRGKKILDFHGNNLHQVGYKNRKVIDAVIHQLNTLPFSPRRYTNVTAVNLAQKLGSIIPGLNRVLYAPGGSEANSMALKLARIVTGRHKVVSMWGSFHGSGMDALSVGGERTFRQNMGPLLPGIEHVPPPVSYRGFYHDDPGQDRSIEYIRYIFENEGDIGALIAETIRNTDVQVPAPGYWKKVRALCDEFGVLLILDEIPIALGRTGKFFAFEHYGIVPDMVTMGKGLGGGVFPMAALLTREAFNIASEQSIGHFTHEKSPVGSAAALAVLEFIEEENLTERAEKLGQLMLHRLLEMKEYYSMIGDVRGMGLLWGIDLVRDRKSKERAIHEAERIMYRCLGNGLSFKVSQGNIINLSPSLIITESQLEHALDILQDAFNKIIR
jgi:4-aminobutyrate aminotransferase